jgi:hypothetical protein
VLPFGDTDTEVHGVQPARGGQLEALRRDLAGGQLGAAKRQVIADEVGEQRRLAGDELRQATRMRGAQLDARARRVDEVQQRGRPADLGQLLAPAGPGRLGDVRGGVPRVTEAQRVGRRHLALRARRFADRVRLEVVIIQFSVGVPHTATLRCRRTRIPWMLGGVSHRIRP